MQCKWPGSKFFFGAPKACVNHLIRSCDMGKNEIKDIYENSPNYQKLMKPSKLVKMKGVWLKETCCCVMIV